MPFLFFILMYVPLNVCEMLSAIFVSMNNEQNIFYTLIWDFEDEINGILFCSQIYFFYCPPPPRLIAMTVSALQNECQKCQQMPSLSPPTTLSISQSLMSLTTSKFHHQQLPKL